MLLDLVPTGLAHVYTPLNFRRQDKNGRLCWTVFILSLPVPADSLKAFFIGILLPCKQLVSPTPNERETTASNRLLFHRASASSSHPTWVIWCQSSFVNNFFAGSVSVQKKQNVSHPKRWQKNDSILTAFLLSFYENDSAVLRYQCTPKINKFAKF